MIKLRVLLAFVILMFVSLPVSANSANIQEISEIEDLTSFQDHLTGGWSYTVEGAPEGYEKGMILIVQEGETYKVQVQIGSSMLLGEKVTVEKNTIRFSVRVEGEKVSVELSASGSKISGACTTPSDGMLKINGVKSLSAGQ